MILYHARWLNPKKGDVFTDRDSRTRVVFVAAAQWVIAR